MRIVALLLAAAFCAAAGTEEEAVLKAVQNIFDGMAAHDAARIKENMTPEARLVSARPGRPATTATRDDFANAIAGNQNQLLERIWEPKVIVRGNIAMVWAEYDFHANGKFNHCGVDTFLLLKTPEGWKVTAISYTSETEGCKPSPLGVPK